MVRSYAGAIEMGEECFPQKKHALLIAVTTAIHAVRLQSEFLARTQLVDLLNRRDDFRPSR
jgi:hypothetical protein